jgi:hypothetical protein
LTAKASTFESVRTSSAIGDGAASRDGHDEDE